MTPVVEPAIASATPTETWLTTLGWAKVHVVAAEPSEASAVVSMPAGSPGAWPIGILNPRSGAAMAALASRSVRSGWGVPGPISSNTVASS